MSGSPRGNVGKKDAKKARKEGLVPCVLYGGKEQIHFVMGEKAFKPILFTPDVFLIKLEIDGAIHEVILQDVQYHPVTDSIMHADFFQITPGKPVKVSVPLTIVGTSKGVLRGGKLVQKFRKLMVKGLVENIPDKIEVDITRLDIGGAIKVSDLKVANVEFLDPASALVVTVRTARALAAAAEEEEAAEGEESHEGETAPAE